MQQYTFLRLTNIFNIVTLLPKKCVSLKDAVQFHWQKKQKKGRNWLREWGRGCVFVDIRNVDVGGWSPNFGHMCMWEGEALVLLIFAEIINLWSLTLFFGDKLIIYIQKSLFTHKTNIWTPCCDSQNQIKSLLILAFELFLKILFSE